MAFFLQVGLIALALVIFLFAYSGIRQGGSRVYSLEREAVLRRASATMFIGAAILIAVIGWLYYENVPAILQAEPEAEIATQTAAAPPTSTPEPGQTQFNQIPEVATVTLTPTTDPNLPTATPTPVIVRAFVKDTGGNGLTLPGLAIRCKSQTCQQHEIHAGMRIPPSRGGPATCGR